MKMKNLMVRTLSGLVLVAVFVGAVLGSQWSFGALLLLILVGGQTEFYKLARETGLSPQRWMGLAVGVLLFALNFIVFRQFSRSVTDEAGGAVLYLLLYIGLLLPTLFVCELFRRSATPLANLGATLLGVLYVAVPLSLLLYVPVLAGDGVWRPETVLCYIFIIWANDVFAYLVGMTFGRHRLCERLSPKKSWEGFFGGLAGAVATGLAAAGLGRPGARRLALRRSGRSGGVDVQAGGWGQGFGAGDPRSRRCAGPLRRAAAFGALCLPLPAAGRQVRITTNLY